MQESLSHKKFIKNQEYHQLIKTTCGLLYHSALMEMLLKSNQIMLPILKGNYFYLNPNI